MACWQHACDENDKRGDDKTTQAIYADTQQNVISKKRQQCICGYM